MSEAGSLSTGDLNVKRKHMRISAVKCLLLSALYAEPGDAEREIHHRTGYRTTSLVKIETDEGLYGLGETNAGVFAPEAVRALVAQFEYDLVGQRVFNTQAVWERMHHASYYWGRAGFTQSVIGGIEMALWDLKGKALGQPVYELLGGSVHEELDVYASGGNPKPMEDLRREMHGYIEAGFGVVKIRICEMSIDQIRAVVQCCRDELGPATDLAVDAVQGIVTRPWSVKHTTQVARAIEPYRIRWMEEPLEVTDMSGMAELRSQISIPVAGGESITTLAEAEAFIKSRAVDLLQIDASVVGGIGVFRRIAQMAQGAGIPLAVHAWGSGVGIMGNYHAAFATPNCVLLEMPTVSNALRAEVLAEPLQVKNQRLQAPRLPGLGVTLPDDFEERFPYRSGSYYRILRH